VPGALTGKKSKGDSRWEGATEKNNLEVGQEQISIN